MMKTLFAGLMLLLFFQVSAQFTEKLDEEISELSSKMVLDGISKEDYFTSLAKISGDIPIDTVQALMTGPKWRYSHTVFPDGREVRLSNARGGGEVS